MKSLLTAFAVVTLLSGGGFAQTAAPAGTCDAEAAAKKLAGAAKNSFLKKCKTDACTGKAIDKNGKPLAGAAKASFLKKCEQDA